MIKALPTFLCFLSLIILAGCKSTPQVGNDTALPKTKEVRLSADRSKFTYLKNGEQFKTKRKLKGTLSQIVTDSIFSYVSREAASEESQVIMINYYPAKTPGNSSGNCQEDCIRKLYKETERRIQKLDNTPVIYLNRPGADLGKYEGAAQWEEDTYFLMERYFVPHPQLGNSFVVLCQNGDYEAYLGEYAQSQLLKTFGRVYAGFREVKNKNQLQ